MSLTVYRFSQDDKATLGVIVFKANDMVFSWYSLELPWRDNKKVVSCIPNGSYDIFIDTSYKNGLQEHQHKVIELKGVPNRSQIQFHIGNFTRNSSGCILVAAKHNNNIRTKVNSGLYILESKKGYQEFFEIVSPYVKQGKVTSVEVVKI